MSLNSLNVSYMEFKYINSDIKTIQNFIQSHIDRIIDSGESGLFPDTPSVDNYDCNNFILNGIESKSFYILFEVINGALFDTSYITISKNNLHFLQLIGLNDDHKLVSQLFRYMKCYNFDDIVDMYNIYNASKFCNCLKEFINKTKSLKLAKQIKFKKLDSKYIQLYKLNPDLLYSDYNINLFKLKGINSL